MNHELAALIETMRERHKLSQSELGKLLGLSRSSIIRLERGERSLTASELLSLASLFGDSFEIGVEHLLADVVADLTARVRQAIGRLPFEPNAMEKRDWLVATLNRLDHSYVAGDA